MAVIISHAVDRVYKYIAQLLTQVHINLVQSELNSNADSLAITIDCWLVLTDISYATVKSCEYIVVLT